MVAFRRSGLASLLALGLTAGLTGCSAGSQTASDSSPPATAVQFALTSNSLPACTKAVDGEIWYVWSAGHFYVSMVRP